MNRRLLAGALALVVSSILAVGSGDGEEAAPAQLAADLAVDLPEVSEGALTYTFTLEDGIRVGPPQNRRRASTGVS